MGMQELPSLSRRAAVRLMLGVGALTLTPRPARADTQAELDAAQQQLDEAQQQLEQIAAEYEELSGEQARTLAEIADVRDDIAGVAHDIELKEADLTLKQERLGRRVASAYKSGGTDLLSILLSASSFEELLTNVYYLDKISESDHRMIDEVKQAKEVLASRKLDLEAHEADLEELGRRQQEQLVAMQGKQDEVQALLDGLSEQVRELMARRDAELAAAAAEAERARAAAAAAAAASSYSVVSPSSLTKGTTGSQSAVINACYTTPTAGYGYCAGWVTNVFVNAGVGSFGGNACDMYNYYCYSADRSELKPGMIVAVSSHPSTVAGRIYGHVGIYVGGGLIMQNVGPITTQTLDDWCAYYGQTVTPRWGWLGGVQLA